MKKRSLLPAPLRKVVYRMPAVHQWMNSLRGGNRGIRQTFELARRSTFAPAPPATTFPRRVLVFSHWWMSIHQAWELLVALGLRLQHGANVDVVRCGRVQTACDLWRLGDDTGRHVCFPCSYVARRFWTQCGFPDLRLDEQGAFPAIRENLARQIEKAGDSLWDGFSSERLNLTEIAGASFTRYLRQYRIPRTSENLDILQRFVLSAGVIEVLLAKMLDQRKPDMVFTLNGKFFPSRIALELCKERGIPIVIYERGALLQTLTLNWNAPAIPYHTAESWPRISARPLTESQNKELDEFLYGRRFGRRMQVNFWPSIEEDLREIEQRIGIRFDDKPVDVLFTNVIWDTAVYNEDTIFASMFHWIDETIRAYAQMPERTLLVRVHPSEIRDPLTKTLETSLSSIQRAFPALPPNVIVIPPESDISSYLLIDKCRRVLAYTSTVGLEAAIAGKPVIQSAHSNYSGKCFTLEPQSAGEYLKLIRSGTETPPADARDLARRFAYLLYFRTMIPIHSVDEDFYDFQFKLNSFDDLRDPGRDSGLLKILDCIRQQRPFHLPLE